MSGRLTRVALTFVAQRINVYLRFGRPVCERIVDARRRVIEFAPGSVFCRMRWEANEFGTTRWQLAVLQAMPWGESMQKIAGVTPGAALLLHVQGASNVQTVLRVIDAIETRRIEPTDVAVSYWRLTNNRIAAHASTFPYTVDRHAAHLAYKALA